MSSASRPRRSARALHRPLRVRDLVYFDLARGFPTALRVLRRRLRAPELARVLLELVRAARRDPFAGLALPSWPAEADALTRHQLRAALSLDDATRRALDWPEAERLALVGAVIAETGAAFVAYNVPVAKLARLDAASAEAAGLLERLPLRLFNARIEGLAVAPGHVRFDVVACRFVELCRALGRPYLAPLFCEADAAFFGRPGSLVTLDRASTLARGGPRCDFSLRLRDAVPAGAPASC